MNGLSWREPELPVVQNVDAEVHDGLQSIRDALVRQLYLPVQCTGVVQSLASTGITRLGECGPGKVLTGLARRIDQSLVARALSTTGAFDAALDAWKEICPPDDPRNHRLKSDKSSNGTGGVQKSRDRTSRDHKT